MHASNTDSLLSKYPSTIKLILNQAETLYREWAILVAPAKID